MKHRSTHIFILVAALLVAAPRASEDLSAIKDALGQRLKSEIFKVFLSLHTNDATPPVRPAAECLFASAAAPRGAKQAAKPTRAATEVEVHARREVPAEVAEETELAAITEPVMEVAGLTPEPARVEAPAYRFELHDPKVMRGRELAMIIPPDVDVMKPPPPPRPAQRESARRAPAPRRRAAEFEARAAAFDVEFKDAIEIKGLSPAELRRQLEDFQTLRFDEQTVRTWTKVLKLKRTAPKPAPARQAPAARAACPEASANAAPARPVICGPSPVEAFYTSE